MSTQRRIMPLLVLIGAVGGVILVMTVFYINSRQMLDDPVLSSDQIKPKADMAMDRVEQVSTRNGRKEWKLNAASAEVIEAENRVRLIDISAVFYLEDGREVYLTANEGYIHTQTNDIEVSGDVVLINEKYRLTTQKMNYADKQRMLAAPLPVNITDGQSLLVADKAIYNLNTNESFFKGNVAGLFSEYFAF